MAMMRAAGATVKRWHTAASKAAGNIGGDTRIRNKLGDAATDSAAVEAARFRRGQHITNAGIAVGGMSMVRGARGSSGSEGIQPHSIGGTTGAPPPPMY